ncbi:MAG: mechanosensitive ion channel family protein [Gemmatimonadota bacterium]
MTGLWQLAQAVPPAAAQMDILGGLRNLFELDTAELARKLIQVVTIWVFAWVLIRALKAVARRIVAATDDGDPNTLTLREKRGQTIAQLVRNLGRVVVVGVSVLMTLNVFINIGPLLAGAGILGLAVSFGAQSLVKDFIAGFFILLENQFAVGDVVEIAGKTGTVERITMRLVVLRDMRGAVHMVPSGQITTVTNLTRSWSRAVLDIGVGYDTDIDHAIEVLRDEARRFAEDPAWASRLDGVPEVLGVESLGDSAVIIRVVIRTPPGAQWESAREFRRRILKRLEAEGIEIPFPQRMVHHKYVGGIPGGPGPVPGSVEASVVRMGEAE